MNSAEIGISLWILLTSVFFFVLVLIFAVYNFYRAKLLSNFSQATKDEFNQRFESLNVQLEKVKLEKENLIIEFTQKSTENKLLIEKLNQQKTEIEELNQKLQKDFELLAQKIFEDKSEKFTQQNQIQLNNLLNPLKEKIQAFETKIENSHKESLEKNASLKQQIEDLSKLNERITQEAHNLTRALKGDQKTQGNWGEVILERILERSGLQKNQEYFVQQNFSSDNQKRFQPDVIVQLPDQKSIVIDSKVSLVAYEKYFNAESDEEKTQALKAHLQSIRQHAKSLSIKEYQNLQQIQTLDFVLMFVPIESAFSVAVQQDSDLFSEAFERNIVIVSPTTLLATLRTIASIWKYENQNRNALEIAQKGAELYDQFVSLTEEITKLGKQLETVQGSYDSVMRKLTGRRNLIKKVEDLKRMGLSTSKSISDKLLNQSDESID